MRKLIVGLVSYCLLLNFPSVGWADSANPPILKSIRQVTQGPYAPGDVITYEVNFIGGNPGVRYLEMDSTATKDPDGNCAKGVLQKPVTEVVNGMNRLLISAVAPSSCVSGTYSPWFVLSDLTNLITRTNWADTNSLKSDPSWDYTLLNGQLVPKGTVRPQQKPDQIDLSNLPIPIYEPGKTLSYSLPRFTKNGQLNYWGVDMASSRVCTLTKPFITDAGGTLNIVGPGICMIDRDTFESHFFAEPTVITKWSLYPSVHHLKAVIVQKGKLATITCVKGKSLKKVTATTPKCPQGYAQK